MRAYRAWVLLLFCSLAACAPLGRASTGRDAGVASSRVETGFASWYGRAHHRHRTANGERFDMNAMTGAHRSLPFGSRVQVTDLESGRSVVVRINDRGPYVKGRVIDLSRAAASALGIREDGVAPVRLEVVPGGRSRAVATAAGRTNRDPASLCRGC